MLFATMPTNEALSYSIGDLYLPAAIGIIPMSMLTAPFGVWLTDVLPAHRLKRLFGYFLLLVAANMIISSLMH
jgi:uncharacterized membrane protein YfcA